MGAYTFKSSSRLTGVQGAEDRVLDGRTVGAKIVAHRQARIPHLRLVNPAAQMVSRSSECLHGCAEALGSTKVVDMPPAASTTC